mgnify:FL=1|jgi:hypothetical protein
MSLEELFYEDFIAPQKKELPVQDQVEDDYVVDGELKFLTFDDFVEPTSTTDQPGLDIVLYPEDDDHDA